MVEFCSKAVHHVSYRLCDVFGGSTVPKHFCFLLFPQHGDNLIGSVASVGLSPSRILLQISALWISVFLFFLFFANQLPC